MLFLLMLLWILLFWRENVVCNVVWNKYEVGVGLRSVEILTTVNC